MFLTSLSVLASEGGENPMLTTWPAGLIAAIVFFLLAMVTLSYKNVANRHAAKAEQFAAEHGKNQHGADHH